MHLSGQGAPRPCSRQLPVAPREERDTALSDTTAENNT